MQEEIKTDNEMIEDLISEGWTLEQSERIVLGFNR